MRVINKIWTATTSHALYGKEEHTLFGERDDLMEHLHSLGYYDVSLVYVRWV